MAHIETWKINPDNNLNLVQDVFNKHYFDPQKIIDKKYLINTLRSIKYVKNPLKFKNDINKEIKTCFKEVSNLVIFNEKYKQVHIYDSNSLDEIVLDRISQNGIKVIEKKYVPARMNYKKTAFNEWKLNKKLNFYELYMNLKNC